MNKKAENLFVMRSPWRRGQLGGTSTSLAKQEAAKRNGRKGGRPKKNPSQSPQRDR